MRQGYLGTKEFCWHIIKKIMELSATISCTSTCRNPFQTIYIFHQKHKPSRHRRPREACTARATNSQQSSASVAVSPTQFSESFFQPDRALPIAAGIVAAISWYLWRQMKNGKQNWPSKKRISGFDGVLEVKIVVIINKSSAFYFLNTLLHFKTLFQSLFLLI